MVVFFDLYGNFAGLSFGSEFLPSHEIRRLLDALRYIVNNFAKFALYMLCSPIQSFSIFYEVYKEFLI